MKKIIVKDCLGCPLVADCKEIKKLTPRQRTIMMVGIGASGILKTCKLENE